MPVSNLLRQVSSLKEPRQDSRPLVSVRLAEPCQNLRCIKQRVPVGTFSAFDKVSFTGKVHQRRVSGFVLHKTKSAGGHFLRLWQSFVYRQSSSTAGQNLRCNLCCIKQRVPVGTFSAFGKVSFTGKVHQRRVSGFALHKTKKAKKQNVYSFSL